MARPSDDSSWVSKAAFATGFPSRRSLVVRSILGIAAVTLVQRFVLYPSAAVAFDISIAIAVLAIMFLFAYVVGRTHYQR